MLPRTLPFGLLISFASTALLVAALAPFRSDLGLLNVGLLFLLLALLLTAYWGWEVGLFAALLTNASLNFFFIEPLHTFTVQAPRNIVALAVFLAVAVIGSRLLASARRAAREARRRQAEAETVLQFARTISSETEPSATLGKLCNEVVRTLNAAGAAVIVKTGQDWAIVASSGSADAGRSPDGAERQLAEQAIALRAIAGMGGGTPDGPRRRRIVVPRGREGALTGAHAVLFAPIHLGEDSRGVLRLDGPMGDSPFRDTPGPILTAIAAEAAVTLHRLDLSREAAHAEALRQADEMKTALMASMSHDLKTPLASIKAAITSLTDKNIRWSQEDIAAFLRTIDSQADRLNRLITDVLDLNRIESGQLLPDRAVIDVEALLRRARDLTAFEAPARKIFAEVTGSVTAVGDEALILQAVVNLIENAIKYSTAAGAVHVRAHSEDRIAVIEVLDEGPGIAAADLPFVFDRFYRAEENNRRVKGSGLGLTIVKSFVELCGGTVSVQSSPAGTTFRIELSAGNAAMVHG
jgi:two-component system sensor histidine kinase KdpD